MAAETFAGAQMDPSTPVAMFEPPYFGKVPKVPKPSTPKKRRSQVFPNGSEDPQHGTPQSPGKVRVSGGQGRALPSRPQTPLKSSFSLEELLPQAPVRVLARRDSAILTRDGDEESVALRPHRLRGQAGRLTGFRGHGRPPCFPARGRGDASFAGISQWN